MNDGPDWIREALRVSFEEAKKYLSTLAHTLIRPRRFATAWKSETEAALNPLGFMATSLGIAGIASATLLQSDGGIFVQLCIALLPYVYYASLALTAHVLLLPFRARSPLRLSLGVALFVAGAQGLVSTLSVVAAFALKRFLYPGANPHAIVEGVSRRATIALSILFDLPALWVLVALALALSAAQGLARWKGLLAILGATLLFGLALGYAHAHGDIELGVPHFVIMRGADTWIADLWF